MAPAAAAAAADAAAAVAAEAAAVAAALAQKVHLRCMLQGGRACLRFPLPPLWRKPP